MERLPWRVRPLDAKACARLEKELGVHAATARCLVARGQSDEGSAGAFVRPRLADLRPPEGLAGFDGAVERLAAAVTTGEVVGLFGDYDVDGVTTTALLTSFLREVGGEVVARVARRDEGYGFTEVAAKELCQRGARLVVTVDCGTSDVPAILACRAVGVSVIVVDHHQVPDGKEHPALALVNPHRPDSRFPFRGLASVGLGFYLAAALRTRLRERGWFRGRPEPDVRTLLDLVALGTLADLAPLERENRILVGAGLRELSARRRPGVAALLQSAGVAPESAVTEDDVGWRLGPRLNAPGRLGDAAPSLALLLAPDATRALAAAAVLEDANQRRRALTEAMVAEALSESEPFAAEAAIVVARRGWHAGVAGIVAAKLVDRFRRPAAVIALEGGQGRGSLRTANGVDLYKALSACSDHLLRYGGHAQAAGVTVAESEVAPLRAAFARSVAAASAAPPAEELLVDARVGVDEVDLRLVRELALLAPFGVGNAPPLFAATSARVIDSRRVGDDGAHLKLVLGQSLGVAGISAIAFRMGERDPGVGASVDVAYRPELSAWRGETRLELRVEHLRAGPLLASAATS